MDATVEGQSGTLSLSGRITADNVVALRDQGEQWLARHGDGGAVTVDLTGVESASSVLLSLLLCWHRAAASEGLQLHYAGVSGDLAELSRLNGVSRWLTGSA